MEFSDTLYKAFLKEMNDLDQFRMVYAAEHPSISIDRDDPDVKRLIEAVAFFSARTYLAGARNITAAQLRLFQQFFPFLLSPIPSMGLIQANISGQVQEKTVFPRGSELMVTATSGDTAIYRTMENLTILPMALIDTRLILRPKGYRLLISFKSMFKRNEDIGRISLNIDYLNNYQTSLYVLDRIKESLQRSFITFDDTVDEDSSGTRCNVFFGHDNANSSKSKEEPSMHPMQESRFFFNFPAQDLFLHIDVPETRQSWDKFTICMDLDANWPGKLIINKDIFRTFTVPVENLKLSSAEPFVYDGTKESFGIRHPEQDAQYELQSITGVYHIIGGRTIPMRSGVLAGGEGSYEIEYRQIQNKNKCYLKLHYSEAFFDPITISVDGSWMQPAFSQVIHHKLDVKPYSRHVAGIKWKIAEALTQHRENVFHENMDIFMYLLSLRNKSRLDYDDIVCLLQVQGSVFNGHFKPVKGLFKTVRVEQTKVQTAAGNSLKFIYHLGFSDCEPSIKPLVKVFTKYVGKILDAWISEAPVETKMELSGL
jgi:type VI secretion system protein ImpG